MFPVWSGAVVTAGDVVFYGTMDGWFKALDARTGAKLWQFKTGSGIVGQPVTYKGPDGKTVRRRAGGRRRLVRRRCRRRPQYEGWHRGAWLRKRDDGPAEILNGGRHALRFRFALSPFNHSLAVVAQNPVPSRARKQAICRKNSLARKCDRHSLADAARRAEVSYTVLWDRFPRVISCPKRQQM